MALVASMATATANDAITGKRMDLSPHIGFGEPHFWGAVAAVLAAGRCLAAAALAVQDRRVVETECHREWAVAAVLGAAGQGWCE